MMSIACSRIARAVATHPQTAFDVGKRAFSQKAYNLGFKWFGQNKQLVLKKDRGIPTSPNRNAIKVLYTPAQFDQVSKTLTRAGVTEDSTLMNCFTKVGIFNLSKILRSGKKVV